MCSINRGAVTPWKKVTPGIPSTTFASTYPPLVTLVILSYQAKVSARMGLGLALMILATPPVLCALSIFENKHYFAIVIFSSYYLIPIGPMFFGLEDSLSFSNMLIQTTAFGLLLMFAITCHLIWKENFGYGLKWTTLLKRTRWIETAGYLEYCKNGGNDVKIRSLF